MPTEYPMVIQQKHDASAARDAEKYRLRKQIADALLKNPEAVIAHAFQALKSRTRPGQRWSRIAWTEILETHPPSEVARLLLHPTGKEQALTDSNPFPGLRSAGLYDSDEQRPRPHVHVSLSRLATTPQAAHAVPEFDEKPEQASSVNAIWKKHPGIVWSNRNCPDDVRIMVAMSKRRFHLILDLAKVFGLERLEAQWEIVMNDPLIDAKTRRADPEVRRILRNIRNGFEQAGRNDISHSR